MLDREIGRGRRAAEQNRPRPRAEDPRPTDAHFLKAPSFRLRGGPSAVEPVRNFQGHRLMAIDTESLVQRS